MKNSKNKPPVYFFSDDKKENKKTFILIKTGKKSYAMSLMNLLLVKKTGTNFKE